MGKIRAVAITAGAVLAGAGVVAASGPVAAAPRHHATHRACPYTSPADGAAAYVQLQLGKPYVFGAAGPNSFDAAGLVVAAYASVGIALPHNTAELAAQSTPVGRDDIQPGDLVFYGTDAPSTVAVYTGNDQVVGVFRPGTVVRVYAINVNTVFAYGRVLS